MPEQTPQDYVRERARALGVPEALALGVAQQESNFNPLAQGQEFDLAPGKKTRAYGMFQVIPETAIQYGADPANPLQSLQDPVKGVDIGLRYLKALFDQHQGQLDPILQTYGGVRTGKTNYIADTTKKIFDWQNQLDQSRGVTNATGLSSPTPHMRAATWGERWLPDPVQHPYLSALVESFDPTKREARQNLAGLAGGIGGGLLLGPLGAVGGAALFGGVENALGEETGLFGGPPPPPDTTPLERTLAAAGWQGAGTAFGEGVAQPFKGVIKRVATRGIAQGALDYFAKARTEALATLRDAVESLTERAGQQTIARNQAGRAAQQAATEATAATRAAGQQSVTDAARAGAADLRDARAAKTGMLDQARDAAARSLRSARARAADLLKRAVAQGAEGLNTESAAYEAGVPPRPSFIDTGQSVIDTVENHARAAYKALGQAVDDAAEHAGTPVDLTEVKAEARRIAREQLLPPETSFPRVPPEAAGPPKPPAPSPILDPSGKPFAAAPAAPAADAASHAADDELDALVRELSDKEREALKNNPAMQVLGRILNAPDSVPFKDAHQFKSQLQAAVRNSYDAVQRSQAEGITMRTAKALRTALSGNAAYDAATAAYEKATPAFTEHVAQTIRSVARDSPEQIVDLLNPERPSHARTLVSLLTDYAEQGGGEAGAQAGRAALQNVRDAWLSKNIYEGGIEHLGERLATLRSRPEFSKALFGDEYGEVFKRLDAINKAYQDKVVEAASLQTAAKMQGKHAVETTADTGRAEIAAARQRAGQLVEGARSSAVAARDAAKTAADAETKRVAGQGKASVEAARQAREAERLATSKDLRAARRAVTTRAAGQSGSPAEIAEQEFARSTLAGRNHAHPEQVAADAVRAAMLGPKNIWGGLSGMRLALGASDADILKYAVHSQGHTAAAIAAIKAAPYVAPAVGTAAVGTARVVNDRQAVDRARRQAADAAARTKPKPQPSEISLTIQSDRR